MAAPSPRSHLCRPVAAQPGCGTASAPQHGSWRSRRAGRRGWAGGGGLLHAPGILKSYVSPPPLPHRLRTRQHNGLRSREPLGNSSAPVPRVDKRLRPPPHARARRTLHGDGRVALLRVLGALHLQLLGRERPVRAARRGAGVGGKVTVQGHGVPPNPSCTLISPPGPSLATLKVTHGCWGGRGDAAWSGAALVAPSSQDAVDPWGTPEQDPQQPGEVTGPTELNSPAVEGLEGAGSQAAATEVLVSTRGARHGEVASRR